MALVAVVGVGVAKIPYLGDKIFDTLKSVGIVCTLPDFVNGSHDHVTVVVKAAQRKEAVKILHRTFVGTKIQRMDIPGSDSFWSHQQLS